VIYVMREAITCSYCVFFCFTCFCDSRHCFFIYPNKQFDSKN